MDAFYREWRDQSLKAWTQTLTPVLESDAFNESMAACTAPMMASQKMVRQMTLDTLAAAGLPSRPELAALSQRLARAEARMLRCQERAEGLATGLQQP